MAISATPFALIDIPPFISISGGPLLNFCPPLSQDEQASVGPLSAGRLAEFAQGRMHARVALAKFGMQDVSIPVADDRSPVWPQGFIGSISHVPADPLRNRSGRVVAVVAHSFNCSGLGVDLERTRALPAESWSTFLTAGELESLAVHPVAQRSAVAHALWSAKEAAMKALLQALDPQDIEIRLIDGDHALEFECRVPRLARTTGWPRLRGWVSYSDGWTAALAMLRSTACS